MNDLAPLPPMQVALLDPEKLDELFADVEALATDLQILLRHERSASIDAAGAYAQASLAVAREALRQRTVMGVQLRYHFEGSDWWDTLSPTEEGTRLVRIKDASRG